MLKIKLGKKEIEDLKRYYKEITEYDDENYNYNIGIWEDGEVARGDLNIDSNSWSRWNDKPAITLTISPIYTTSGIKEVEEIEETEELSEEALNDWAREAELAINDWAEDFAEELAEGIETDNYYAPFPIIKW